MKKALDFSFTVDVDDVQIEPRAYKLKASEQEMTELKERFGLVKLSSFNANVAVSCEPKAKAIWIRGDIAAELVQQCVVTLGDVPEQVAEPFELMLVSPEVAEQFDEDEVYLDPKAPDYDAFEGDTLPVGEMVAQTLSVLMNPYPKQADAKITVQSGQGVSINEDLEEKPNPFAVLSKLRDKS